MVLFVDAPMSEFRFVASNSYFVSVNGCCVALGITSITDIIFVMRFCYGMFLN